MEQDFKENELHHNIYTWNADTRLLIVDERCKPDSESYNRIHATVLCKIMMIYMKLCAIGQHDCLLYLLLNNKPVQRTPFHKAGYPYPLCASTPNFISNNLGIC